MQVAVQMQVQPTMISRLEEQISLCSPPWTWNPKRSLTDLQSPELQDGPRTVTGEVRAIRGPSKKKKLGELNIETSEGSTHTHSMSLALEAVTCKGLTPNSTCDPKFNVSSPWSGSRKCDAEWLLFPSIIHKRRRHRENIEKLTGTMFQHDDFLILLTYFYQSKLQKW